MTPLFLLLTMAAAPVAQQADASTPAARARSLRPAPAESSTPAEAAALPGEAPAAAPAAPEQPALEDGAEACATIDVQPSNVVRRSLRARWTARDVVSLEFRGRLMPRLLDRRVELRVLTPQGDLYQTLAAAGDPQGLPGRMAGRGPRSARARADRALLATMPVAGTVVTQRGLFGRWTVEPRFAGESRPCGHAVAFELLP